MHSFPWTCPHFKTKNFHLYRFFKFCRNVCDFDCYFLKLFYILMVLKCTKRFLLLFKKYVIIILYFCCVSQKIKKNIWIQQSAFKTSQKTAAIFVISFPPLMWLRQWTENNGEWRHITEDERSVNRHIKRKTARELATDYTLCVFYTNLNNSF